MAKSSNNQKPEAPSSGPYYPFLDGFRAVSILWVILHHVFIFFDSSALAFPAFIPALLFAKLGVLGVDMFFVISGFLITGLLVNDLNDRVRIKRFYLRRIFKIVPPYLGAVLGGLIVLMLYNTQTVYTYGIKDLHDGAVHLFRAKTIVTVEPRLWLNYLVFIQNYTQPVFTLGHLWSIAVEEHFYLFYPLVLGGIARVTANPEQRKRNLILVLILLVGLTQMFRLWCLMSLRNPPYQSTLFRIDALMFGCLLRLFEPSLKSLSSQKTKFLAPAALLTGIFLYALIFLSSYLYYAYGSGSTVTTSYVYTAYYLAPGFLILSAMLGFKPLLNILNRRVLIGIGKNSYGIYLWHYVIALPCVSLQQWIPAPAAIGLYIAGALGAGYLSTATIERYFLNLRKQWIP